MSGLLADRTRLWANAACTFAGGGRDGPLDVDLEDTEYPLSALCPSREAPRAVAGAVWRL